MSRDNICSKIYQNSLGEDTHTVCAFDRAHLLGAKVFLQFFRIEMHFS